MFISGDDFFGGMFIEKEHEMNEEKKMRRVKDRADRATVEQVILFIFSFAFFVSNLFCYCFHLVFGLPKRT